VAIFCGHEIQINDHQGDVQKTGSIYNFDPVLAPDHKPQPKGTWVDYELRIEGQEYTILRNGEVLNTFTNSPGQESSRDGDPSTSDRQFASGFIGLQNHASADIIDFRNVRVLPLDEGTVQGPIVIDEPGRHTVEFRSIDHAGNAEEAKSLAIGEDEPGPGPGPGPGDPGPGDPGPGEPPAGQPSAEIMPPAKGQLKLRKFVRKGLEVSATCQNVESGKLAMRVNGKTAKRLGLKGKRLASTDVRCGREGRLDALLEVKGAAKRALKRYSKRGKALKATLRLELTGAGGSATDQLKVRLKGARKRSS